MWYGCAGGGDIIADAIIGVTKSRVGLGGGAHAVGVTSNN